MDSTALKESLILHCKTSIKSLRQLLTTLQSGDGLQELLRDEETMAALSEIASLASSVSGTARQSLGDGADPVVDETISDSTRYKPPFTIPSVEEPPLPKNLTSEPSGPSMGFSLEGKRLHSVLLHYPLRSMIGPRLPLFASEGGRIQKEIELVISAPLASKTYPRIRHLKNQIVLIIHDDVEELEELRTRFLRIQRSV